MKKVNPIVLVLGALALYYFYAQSKKKAAANAATQALLTDRINQTNAL